MKQFKKYCYLILLLWVQTAIIGYGQSPNPAQAHPGQSSDFERTICEKFSRNMSAPELVVCPEGYRNCFTKAYVLQHGKLDIFLKGCWLQPEAEEGRCMKSGCLFGKRLSVGFRSARTCCCRGFACNKNSTIVDRYLVANKPYMTSQTTHSGSPARKHKTNKIEDISPKETVILGVISSVFATFLILSIVFVSWRCAAQKNKLLMSSNVLSIENAVEDIVEYSSIRSEEITFHNLIHKGKFADIWDAEVNGNRVAFKIFKPDYLSNWKNEKTTYDILGSHPNVAEFVSGVELLGQYKSGKAIIVTYYPLGSLLQFLTMNVLSWQTMYNLIFSLASGVAYIHGEIDEYDHFRRKVIVHRNLNSGNVLVKSDSTCVLSNFDTAVRVTGKQILPIAEGGSIPYMSPEVLCGAVNWNDWESSLKQSDVYSVGLIFWEILRRCKDFYSDPVKVPEAVLPYQLELGSNPTMAQMATHVRRERRRPLFPAALKETDKSDSLLRSTIEECWDSEPEARLTALCVVKRMQEIRNIKVISNDPDLVVGPFLGFSSSKFELSSHSSIRELCSPENIRLDDLHVHSCQPTVKCCCSSEQSDEASAKMKLIQDEGCFHSEGNF